MFLTSQTMDYKAKFNIEMEEGQEELGFVKSPKENISLRNRIVFEEELPELPIFYEVQVKIEPMEEPESEDLQLENVDSCYSDVEETLQYHSEPEFNILNFKTETEDQKVLGKTRRASDMTRTTAAEKPKHYTPRKNLEEIFSEGQKKNEKSEPKFITTTEKVIFKEPPKCPVCHRGFIYKSILVKHLRTHYGEQPYKCDICHRSCSNKCDLLKHIRTHSDEKSYKCNKCQLSFSSMSHLIRHFRKHTGEKPYKCNICQSGCNSKGDFLKHIRTHVGKIIYKCNVCQPNLRNKNNFTVHICTHHGGKPYKCDIPMSA